MVRVWDERETTDHSGRVHARDRDEGGAAQGRLDRIWEVVHLECEFSLVRNAALVVYN